MSLIEGRAKKYDGTAIDYVSIFNWVDGTCIAQVIPDASGNWEFNYYQDINIGLTYVANGCEPITHGPYEFLHQSTIPTDAILHYDFNGDILDKSTNALNGINDGSTVFVQGRKAGSQALKFSGSTTIKTPAALPINSDKISISFWFRTGHMRTMYLMATVQNSSTKRGLTIDAHNYVPGNMDLGVEDNGSLNTTGVRTVFDNVWHHAVCTIDRSAPASDITTIYIDDVLIPRNAKYNKSMTGNFDNSVLMIGDHQYFSSLGYSYKYVGEMQDLRVYNRLLSSAERAALFNE